MSHFKIRRKVLQHASPASTQLFVPTSCRAPTEQCHFSVDRASLPLPLPAKKTVLYTCKVSLLKWLWVQQPFLKYPGKRKEQKTTMVARIFTHSQMSVHSFRASIRRIHRFFCALRFGTFLDPNFLTNPGIHQTPSVLPHKEKPMGQKRIPQKPYWQKEK